MYQNEPERKMRDSYTQDQDQNYNNRTHQNTQQRYQQPSNTYSTSYTTQQQPAIRTVTNVLNGHSTTATSEIFHQGQYGSTTQNVIRASSNVRTGTPTRQANVVTTQYIGQPTVQTTHQTTTYNSGWQQTGVRNTNVTRTSHVGSLELVLFKFFV